ncbi:MAG: ABC transporter permease [Bacteroidales bacterium]|nr:ABC transporter permease [Bacteroidales bacterium]MBR4817372.1 ABC transporter permease [Bacteroidales bacterium]MBR5054270.1 ABC transporter permease [Bacteroidales bacterium]
MNASSFIAKKLRFKGRIAMASVAISFLVMIIAVSVSSGFRREIRSGIASISGDIQLTPADMNYIGEESPVSSEPPSLGPISEVQGVKSVQPVIYRAGIVKKDDNIHGVIFKGVTERDSLVDLGISIPDRLSEILDLGEGDDLQAYFVGERVKARRFHIRSVYRSPVRADDNLIVLASLEDMRRLNGWEEDEVSALEITLDEAYRDGPLMRAKTDEIGTLALVHASDDDDSLVASSIMDKYPQLFDWLNLIDFNALAVLILMTVVAGFNMISGLLILLFRSISTIGTLKAMGMTDKSISAVFMRVSSNLVLKGMLIGNAVALALCALQNATHFLKLNPDNYFISYVPLKVNIPLILVADLAAYAVIMLLLQIPVRFISKVDPALTVRAQ